MAAIHNYYRILGIKTTAGIQEINQAIAALRQKDAAGNYSATINTIAATLSEPQKRAAYDDELGLDAALRGDYYVAIQAKEEPKKQTFVDVSGKEYGSEQALRNAQKARYNQMTLELEEWEKSVATRTRFLSMGRSLVFLFMLALALLIGFFSGKPFYDDYRAEKQAEAAYVELTKAGKSVMDYMRANQTFPDTVPSFAREGDYYDMKIVPENSIELRFNQNAQDGLQDSSILFELYQIPNGALDWRCRARVPTKYIPARCPVN
jgi:hypothetical protein